MDPQKFNVQHVAMKAQLKKTDGERQARHYNRMWQTYEMLQHILHFAQMVVIISINLLVTNKYLLKSISRYIFSNRMQIR